MTALRKLPNTHAIRKQRRTPLGRDERAGGRAENFPTTKETFLNLYFMLSLLNVNLRSGEFLNS